MRYKDCFDKERRDFLRVVKHAGISAGVLRASSLISGVMLARVAEAQGGAPNKSCLVFSGGGALTTENQKTGQANEPLKPDYWFPSGGTLPAMSAPLQSYFNNLVFLKNATLSGAGHGVMFNRFDNGSFSKDSFDVNMGRTISANYPVKYLNVGTDEVTGLSREGYTTLTTMTSPQAALDALFGGGTTPVSGIAPRKSMVDIHYQAINGLRNKLGQHEKIKLDSHFTSLEEIEAAIGTGGGGGGGGGSCPQPPSNTAVGFDALARLHTDIIVLALSCNLTASVSIAFGTDAHTHKFDKLGGRESHSTHHFNLTNYTEDIVYMQGLTKNLLDKLSAAGLLSTTIFTQVSDMGNPDAHNNVDVPIIVGGGGIAGGRVIDVSKKTQASLYQTIGLRLKADQSPGGAAYRNWDVPVISEL
ncbi:MAG TPA: DUF1552 domain-containing protein [Cellvibrio sp.]|nr:DUF1552 domain-containing protein [Cellvibrio sp.]